MTEKKLITINATEARRHFGQVIEKAYRDEKHFVVEKNGTPVVAIIGLEDYENYRRMLALQLLEQLNRELNLQAQAQGVTEEKLLEMLEEDREEVFRERYGSIAP